MLLVLTDSALPLGSFAFSSGLESFIAHRRPKPTGPSEIQRFLTLSLASISSTTLPYVLTAHCQTKSLLALDDELDASTLCQVTRKASIAQGRALLGVWERSLVESVEVSASNADIYEALTTFAKDFRRQEVDGFTRPIGHLPPLWGAVCRAMSVPATTAAYVYLFKHSQAVLSAAVRASAIGPYQAQTMLASKWLRVEIQAALEADWTTETQDAGQVVPVMELWTALHEKLYTRIFSS